MTAASGAVAATAALPRRRGRMLAKFAGNGPALDNDRYAQLAKPSKAVAPTTYPSVEPKLFDRIIEQTLSGPRKTGVGAAWCPPGSQVGG